MNPIMRGEHNMARIPSIPKVTVKEEKFKTLSKSEPTKVRKTRSDKGIPRGSYNVGKKRKLERLEVELDKEDYKFVKSKEGKSFLEKETKRYAREGYKLVYKKKLTEEEKTRNFINKINARLKKNAEDDDEYEAMLKVLEDKGFKLKEKKIEDKETGETKTELKLDPKSKISSELMEKVEEMVPVSSKTDRSHGDYFHMATDDFYDAEIMKEIDKLSAEFNKMSGAALKEAKIGGTEMVDPKSYLSLIGHHVHYGEYREAAEARRTLLSLINEAKGLKG